MHALAELQLRGFLHKLWGDLLLFDQDLPDGRLARGFLGMESLDDGVFGQDALFNQELTQRRGLLFGPNASRKEEDGFEGRAREVGGQAVEAVSMGVVLGAPDLEAHVSGDVDLQVDREGVARIRRLLVRAAVERDEGDVVRGKNQLPVIGKTVPRAKREMLKVGGELVDVAEVVVTVDEANGNQRARRSGGGVRVGVGQDARVRQVQDNLPGRGHGRVTARGQPRH